MDTDHPHRDSEPTIYDVAKRAGVSIGTVSHALNSPTRVRPQTLERVNAAVRELGFVPKVEASVRARRATHRIGVLGRFSSIPSSSERLHGILDAAAADGFEVAVYDQQSSAFHLHLADSLSLSHKLDGLILVDVPIADALARRLEKDNRPAVLIEYARPGVSNVGIDNVAGGRIAARYLAERGYRRCGFLGLFVESDTSVDYPAVDDLRLEGFQQGLAEAAIGLPDRYITRAPIRFSSRQEERDIFLDVARRAARDLLDTDPRPEAIFANFDLVATIVLAVARESGLRVPHDVAVIGFDDAEYAAFLGLTTVRQHLFESGRVAFQLVRDQLTGGGSRVAKSVTLPLEVISRSTA